MKEALEGLKRVIGCCCCHYPQLLMCKFICQWLCECTWITLSHSFRRHENTGFFVKGSSCLMRKDVSLSRFSQNWDRICNRDMNKRISVFSVFSVSSALQQRNPAGIRPEITVYGICLNHQLKITTFGCSVFYSHING